MAFALIGIGLLLFMAAYHNNVAALGSQVSSDITGSSGFFIWVVALLIIGLFGYVPVLRGVSRWFLVLILVVLFLSNKGFFSQLVAALGIEQSSQNTNGVQTPNTPVAPQTPQSAPSSGSTGGGGGW